MRQASSLGFLLHPRSVRDLAFDATGSRLATVCREGPEATLRLWDPRGELLLMPACPLPDGMDCQSLALSPDGTRALLTTLKGPGLLYELPPVLTTAPPWLAALAQRHAGLTADPSADPGAPRPGDPPSPAATWNHWLTLTGKDHPVSPGLSQTQREYDQIAAQPGRGD